MVLRRVFRKRFLGLLTGTAIIILVLYFSLSTGLRENAAVPITVKNGPGILKAPEQEASHDSQRNAEAHTESNPREEDTTPVQTNPNPHDVYEQRANRLREACKAVASNTGKNTAASVSLKTKLEKDLFVSSKHRLVYCAIQKAGSSFWKRAFRVLNGMAPPGSLFVQSGLASHTRNENITFHNRTSQWQQDTLKSSLKFLFVRDPFSRVFSAYVDKVFLPSFREVVHISSNNLTLQTSSSSFSRGQTECHFKPMTFSEFVEVIHTYMVDDHFTSMHQHCDPCQIPFDIVGKMETFRQDTEHVLHRAGISLSHVAADNFTFDARSDLSIMSDLVVRTLTTPAWKELQHASCWAARDQLLRRLWTVFHIRGLLSAEVAFPLTPPQSANATVPDLLQAVRRAYDMSGDREQRLKQRGAAMAEAFRWLSLDSLVKLRGLYEEDCVLFDYHCSLDSFFSLRNRTYPHRFFTDWS